MSRYCLNGVRSGGSKGLVGKPEEKNVERDKRIIIKLILKN